MSQSTAPKDKAGCPSGFLRFPRRHAPQVSGHQAHRPAFKLLLWGRETRSHGFPRRLRAPRAGRSPLGARTSSARREGASGAGRSGVEPESHRKRCGPGRCGQPLQEASPGLGDLAGTRRLWRPPDSGGQLGRAQWCPF